MGFATDIVLSELRCSCLILYLKSTRQDRCRPAVIDQRRGKGCIGRCSTDCLWHTALLMHLGDGDTEGIIQACWIKNACGMISWHSHRKRSRWSRTTLQSYTVVTHKRRLGRRQTCAMNHSSAYGEIAKIWKTSSSE